MYCQHHRAHQAKHYALWTDLIVSGTELNLNIKFSAHCVRTYGYIKKR